MEGKAFAALLDALLLNWPEWERGLVCMDKSKPYIALWPPRDGVVRLEITLDLPRRLVGIQDKDWLTPTDFIYDQAATGGGDCPADPTTQPDATPAGLHPLGPDQPAIAETAAKEEPMKYG